MEITITRFSDEGFSPQLQSYHLNKNKTSKFVNDNEDRLKMGVWVFLKDHEHFFRLWKRIFLKKWEATVPSDLLVVNTDWDKFVKITDPIVKRQGCFIPKDNLKFITNVKRLT
jgi:hypothetical protein